MTDKLLVFKAVQGAVSDIWENGKNYIVYVSPMCIAPYKIHSSLRYHLSTSDTLVLH